jgi:hypothetical protein
MYELFVGVEDKGQHAERVVVQVVRERERELDLALLGLFERMCRDEFK